MRVKKEVLRTGAGGATGMMERLRRRLFLVRLVAKSLRAGPAGPKRAFAVEGMTCNSVGGGPHRRWTGHQAK